MGASQQPKKPGDPPLTPKSPPPREQARVQRPSAPGAQPYPAPGTPPPAMPDGTPWP